ncbi:hypothetical protein ILYODFUR_037000 [Ilyodon furcidens]|uniref:Uncharacterized protein n=1 Tax=Ilyodon furcidens TaxID=33524 RepID=A0ABV0U1Z9_9TELE
MMNSQGLLCEYPNSHSRTLPLPRQLQIRQNSSPSPGGSRAHPNGGKSSHTECISINLTYPLQLLYNQPGYISCPKTLIPPSLQPSSTYNIKGHLILSQAKLIQAPGTKAQPPGGRC